MFPLSRSPSLSLCGEERERGEKKKKKTIRGGRLPRPRQKCVAMVVYVIFSLTRSLMVHLCGCRPHLLASLQVMVQATFVYVLGFFSVVLLFLFVVSGGKLFFSSNHPRRKPYVRSRRLATLLLLPLRFSLYSHSISCLPLSACSSSFL